MADVKISQLPEVIDPYLTDVLPIVNNNDTKKVTVGNIVALGYQGNDVRALTGKYEESSSIVNSTSANWNSAYNIGTAYSLISSNFLTSETDSQLLTYEENSTSLYISNGNNVSLSALNYQGTDLKALTGRYEAVSTNVQTNSADWEKAYDIGTAYSLASSTFITFETDNQTLSYNVTGQDLTIRDGNTVSLFSLASKPYVNSYFLPLTGGTLTNSLCALSSLYVGVTSTTLFVGDGVVGVLTETPNVEFTVNGQISSNNVIYDRIGNSDQWNSSFDASTAYRDISGSFVDVRTAVNNTSAEWDSAYDASTIFRSTSANYAVYNYVNSTFLQLTGGTINGDLSINGNLFLEGSATLVGAKNLVLDDPIIYLAEGNPTDLFDMGFVASYDHSLAGLSAHTGLLRNRNDKKWVLFSGLSSNLLSATQVDFNDPSLTIDTIKANLEGNVVGGTIRGTTLSATGIVYALNGNSDQWNSAYDASVSYRDISGSFVDIRTAVNNTSAEWDSAYDATTAYRDISGSFVDIRTAVNNTSAEWDSAYDASAAYRDISGSFVDVRTAVNNTSAQWDSAFNWSSLFTQVSSRYGSSSTVVEANSADWKTAYNHATAYSSNSGSYATNTTLNTVSSQLVLTSDFNNYKTDVAGITATFLPTTIYSGASGNWESAYTTFKNASSTFLTSETDSQTLSFNEATKDLSISNGNTISLSALTDLTSVDTGVRALTSNWESVYLTVKSLSSNWEESSEILPTVTNHLSSQNVLISSLTVINNLSAGGNLYGNGSNLTGIVAGDTEATTLVRTNSGNWDKAYDIGTAYSSASSTFLTSETDSQTLSFNESNKQLSISNGNTISLSALTDLTSVDTGVRALTSNWQTAYNQGTVYSSNSSSYVTNTTLNSISSQLVLTSDFNNYKTSVAGITSTFLPTTTYQSASGNWQNTYTSYTTNSASFIKTTTAPAPGLSAVNTIVAVSALPVSPDPNTLYIVI